MLLYNEKIQLRQLIQGDEIAFKSLFEAYKGRVFRYILSIIKNRETAEEMVIDVFLKIWQQRELLQEVEDFDAFLFKMAFNKSVDFLRRAGNDPLLRDVIWRDLQLAGDLRSDASVMIKEFESRIKQAVDQLSPQRQLVFRLSRENNYSHSDIARKLQLSKFTVSNHITESLRSIRAYLANFLPLLFVSLFCWLC